MNIRSRFIGTSALCLVMGTASIVFAGERYTPLFSVDVPYDPQAQSSMVTDYMKASQSKTVDEALRRWEEFIAVWGGKDAAIGDLTELNLVRYAYYELARLYYLTGNQPKADELLRKVDDFAVFSLPSKKQVGQWCQNNGYCSE